MKDLRLVFSNIIRTTMYRISFETTSPTLFTIQCDSKEFRDIDWKPRLNIARETSSCCDWPFDIRSFVSSYHELTLFLNLCGEVERLRVQVLKDDPDCKHTILHKGLIEDWSYYWESI
jgi:hypothetical protein